MLSRRRSENGPLWVLPAMVASTIVMGIGLERYSRQTGEYAVVVEEVVEAEVKQETVVVK